MKKTATLLIVASTFCTQVTLTQAANERTNERKNARTQKKTASAVAATAATCSNKLLITSLTGLITHLNTWLWKIFSCCRCCCASTTAAKAAQPPCAHRPPSASSPQCQSCTLLHLVISRFSRVRLRRFRSYDRIHLSVDLVAATTTHIISLQDVPGSRCENEISFNACVRGLMRVARNAIPFQINIRLKQIQEQNIFVPSRCLPCSFN